MKKAAYTTTTLLLAASSLFLTACGGYNNAASGANTTATATQKADANVLNFGTNEAIPQIDPAGTAANTAFREMYMFYDRLVTYTGTDTQVHPMLATSWDISKDGKTYTFHLVQNAKFHDGTPVTAAAVKYSFIRAIAVGKSAAGIFSGIIDKNSFEIVDDYTIKIHLLEPYAGFLSTMGTVYASIINPKLQDHYQGSDLGQGYLSSNEMGSGPYTLASWDRSHEMVMKANPNYWGAKPKIQTVNIIVTPEPSTARLMLEKGQLDILEPNMISPDVVQKMKSEPGINILTAPGFQINDLVMNVTKKPFDNPLVRQAIASAIDYNTLIQSVYGGQAIRIGGIVPKGMFGYNPDTPMYNYDPTKAKQLLTQAGYANGFTTEMEISTNNDIVSNEAVIIQADLQKVGITLNLKQLAWPTFIDSVTHGQHQMALAGWTPDYADPDDNLWYFADSTSKGPGFNLAFYGNSKVDQLLNEGRATTDSTKRQQIYAQVQDIMAKDEPYIFLAQLQVVEPARSWVQGLYVNPMNTWYIPFDTLTKQG